MPFVDIGNRYILPQAQYLPSALAGLSWTHVAAAVRDPSSSIARDTDGAANIITAAICTLTHGQPGRHLPFRRRPGGGRLDLGRIP